MAKPNLLTVTLGPTGEAVFSFEVAKGYLVSETHGQAAPWGMCIHAAPMNVSSSQVRVFGQVKLQ